MSKIKTSFDMSPIKVSLDKLEETAPKSGYRAFWSYHSILPSIREVGILQPIIICPAKRIGYYKILDGHLRYYALRALKEKYACCIVSLDDERYTFEAQINHINPIQRAKMIEHAIKQGASAEKIAKALDVDVKRIIADMNVTQDIEPKAMELLKSAPVPAASLKMLRKAKPLRQLEIAESMLHSNNFSARHVQGMILSTPPELLREEVKAPKRFILSESVSNVATERANMETRIKEVKPKYNNNVYELTTIISFLRRILENKMLSGYLKKHFEALYDSMKEIAVKTKLE